MKDKRIIIAPIAILVIALTVWLVLRDGDNDDGRITASGTIEGTEADLGFQIGGRVAQVNVREGDRVPAVAILARIDQDELDARQTAAIAQTDAARAVLAELQHGARPEEVRQSQSSVTAAQQRMQESEAALTRARRLYEGGAISKEALDQALTAHTAARAQYQQSREQLSMVNQGPRRERIDAQRAIVAR